MLRNFIELMPLNPTNNEDPYFNQLLTNTPFLSKVELTLYYIQPDVNLIHLQLVTIIIV